MAWLLRIYTSSESWVGTGPPPPNWMAHWSIALSVLTLMATGWLVANAPSVAAGASDLHAYAASVLMAGLALRIWLLVADRGVGGWEALVPARTSLPAMKQMLMFYFTLGKAQLPNWYGHNPLWVPVYALFYLFLVVMVVTGLVMPESPVFAGFYLPGIHRAFTTIIAGVALVHLIAVVLHDIKGKALGVPVYELLGGHIKPLPCYASTTHGDHNGGLDAPQAYADFSERCLEMGYPAFKIHGWVGGPIDR